MSRIAGVFEALKSQGRCALIPYVTAGDPAPEYTLPLMHALVEGGADIIELGVPFSDPMADGPVIQGACERALLHHTSLRQVLDLVSKFRETNADTPVVLMGYLNPIERMGYTEFVDKAAASGVDGVLTVDMPPEESSDFIRLLKEKSLDPIYLLSPTTTESRIEMIANAASGFLYYVSLKGVTGAANLDVDSVRKKLDQIKSHTQLPVGVGFGIRDAKSAASVAEHSDAVVVGSALIKIIEQNQGDMGRATSLIKELLSSMRQSIDQVRAKQLKEAG